MTLDTTWCKVDLLLATPMEVWGIGRPTFYSLPGADEHARQWRSLVLSLQIFEEPANDELKNGEPEGWMLEVELSRSLFC
jgi:hypothetical protein